MCLRSSFPLMPSARSNSRLLTTFLCPLHPFSRYREMVSFVDVIDAALSAACDAGLANVARSLLATRLRHRPDDALMGVLRSFSEPA